MTMMKNLKFKCTGIQFFLFLRTGLKFTLIVKEITCTEHMETGCSGEHLDSHRSK